jgi:hypothetical protein
MWAASLLRQQILMVLKLLACYKHFGLLCWSVNGEEKKFFSNPGFRLFDPYFGFRYMGTNTGFQLHKTPFLRHCRRAKIS